MSAASEYPEMHLAALLSNFRDASSLNWLHVPVQYDADEEDDL